MILSVWLSKEERTSQKISFSRRMVLGFLQVLLDSEVEEIIEMYLLMVVQYPLLQLQ